MKLSQLKQILKESAKEAVIEVLNEILVQQPPVQRVQEVIQSRQVAPVKSTAIEELKSKMSQRFQNQFMSQPLQESYLQPNSTGEVPQTIPKNYMDSLFKTVASRTTTQELRDAG